MPFTTAKIPTAHLIFGGTFGLFFLIGLITLLVGCNPNIEGQCIAYDLVDASVYGYKFVTGDCSKCVSKRKGHCTHTEHYTCYSSYLRYEYNNNQTCLFETVSESRSQDTAYNGAVKYPIGYERQLIKSKASSACVSPGVGMDTWIVGVVFMSLCAVVLLAWAVLLYLERMNGGKYFTSYTSFMDYDERGDNL